MTVEIVTARFTLGLDYEADIPAGFALQLREAAKAEGATDFIKNVDADFQDDLQLALYVIGENVRQKVRRFILAQLNNGGLAGRVSPVRTTLAEEPEFVEVRDVEGGEAASAGEDGGGLGGTGEVARIEPAAGPTVGGGFSESDGGDPD